MNLVTRRHPWRGEPAWSAVDIFLAALAALAVIHGAYVAIRFADQPLLEAHGFRQTQTALTAYWLLRDGPAIAYETPVAGAPWSIPFELPIYQALAACAAFVTRVPLSSVGRILSWVFLVASAWPALSICSRLKLERPIKLAFLALWMSSPLYVFWGRSFMIETAALCLSLAAVPYAIDLIEGRSEARNAIGAAAFFTLAMLQKVTTCLPLLLVLGLCWLAAEWRRRRTRDGQEVVGLLAPLAAFAVPIVSADLWTRYADSVKRKNAFGAQLTSDVLRGWEFGSWQQRISSELYADVIWNRIVHENAGGVLGAVLIVSALSFRVERRLRFLILLCAALVAVPLLIFVNLHIVHVYYQMSCGVFAAAALALAVAGWLPRIVRHRAVVPAATTLFLILNVVHFHQSYWETTTARFPAIGARTLKLAEVLKRYTGRDTAFVAFGYDWNSELAYYAERKSFTIPEWFTYREAAWSTPQSYLGDAPLGAVVTCPSTSGPSRDQVLTRYRTERRWSLVELDDCDVLIATPGTPPSSDPP